MIQMSNSNKLFILFLHQNDAYDKFMNNFEKTHRLAGKDYLDDYLMTQPHRCYFTSAFHWDSTPEGYQYWIDKRRLWDKSLRCTHFLNTLLINLNTIKFYIL